MPARRTARRFASAKRLESRADLGDTPDLMYRIADLLVVIT